MKTYVLEAENHYASILRVFSSREAAEREAMILIGEPWEEYFEGTPLPETFDAALGALEPTDWTGTYLIQISELEIES